MRGLFSLDGTQIKYSFRRTKSYQIGDPEEKVRADTIAFLVLSKGYDSRKIDTEVEGSHNDFADIVLYEDDRCTKPWLVVENTIGQARYGPARWCSQQQRVSIKLSGPS